MTERSEVIRLAQHLVAVTDLRYSDVEEDLRASVRSAVAAGGDAAKLWRRLAVEMGLAGLAIPERYGGAGASFREAAVVCEELGRAVAPVPYLGSAVVATAVLLAGADEALLGELAAGTRIAALAVPFETAPRASTPAPAPAAAPPTAPTPARAVAVDGDVLTGHIAGVADALIADVLLVPAGDGLFAVDAADTTRVPVVSLDMTRPLCDIALRAVPGRRLATGDPAAAAVDAGLTAGAALLASEQVGIAQWCLDSTVDHLRSRYQFGRPIGSFQALKHRLADVWVELNQARAVARYAAACLATRDPDTPVAVALAQAHCGPTAVTAAEECVQMHGGIGFTWEHPAHRYLKRAKADAIGFGTADRHRSDLATLVDLPGPAR